MKISLSQEEVKNIVASMELEDIKMYSGGEYKRWHIEDGYDGTGVDIEYLYTEKGNTKEKFKKSESSEVKE